MTNKLKIYCAGGWFSPNQDEVLTFLENFLKTNEQVSPYFPRHDGIKLNPGEFHDPELRKKVFLDNVEHIDSADIVVAALDGRDGFYDTGTMWEVGYAMSKKIPVIAYDTTEDTMSKLPGIYKGFLYTCHTEEQLRKSISMVYIQKGLSDMPQKKIPTKILFVGPDTTEAQRETNSDIVSSVIVECHGGNFRWLDNLSYEEIAESTDSVFKDVDYMVSVIDDRHPIVSWMMGQAYNRNIPVITYTNFNYDVNIMLLCSLHYHCKGKEELRDVMQKMRREGIYSLPKFDDSKMKAM